MAEQKETFMWVPYSIFCFGKKSSVQRIKSCLLCAMALASWMKSLLQQIPKIRRVITGANTVFRLYLSIKKRERRSLQPGHRNYRTRLDLRAVTEVFDRRLTAAQRVQRRFGKPRKPDALPIEIDKAKILRGIGKNLVAIDV